MKDKEKWIGDVVDSIKDIKRAEAPEGIEMYILQGVSGGKRIIRSVSPAIAWQIAAGLILLAGINLFSVLHFNEDKRVTDNNKNPVVAEYFNYINSF